MKVCTRCKEEKDESLFQKDRHVKSGLKATCKVCCKEVHAESYKKNKRKVLDSQKIYYIKNKEKIARTNKKYREKMKIVSPKNQMVTSARNRAKKQGLDFNITKYDFEIPEVCPILGIDLFKSDRSGANPNSPSLDRLVPSKGYTKGNVWVISKLANYMKNSASFDELMMFALWIIGGMSTNGQIPEHDKGIN